MKILLKIIKNFKWTEFTAKLVNRKLYRLGQEKYLMTATSFIRILATAAMQSKIFLYFTLRVKLATDLHTKKQVAIKILKVKEGRIAAFSKK